MTRIAELSADELAGHAFNIFLAQGRHIEGARLIYQALQLDSRQPKALRCLSDFHAHEGTGLFSAVALEYALADDHALTEQDRHTLDELRFISRRSWGFARHNSGQIHLDGGAFKQRDDFTLDQDGYDGFLAGIVTSAGSLQAACPGGQRLCGVPGGLLRHTGTPSPGFDDLPDPANFVEAEMYRQWPRTPTDSLDELAQSVRATQKNAEAGA